MHKAEKKQLRSSLKIGLTRCLVQKLTTSTLQDELTQLLETLRERHQPTHSLISLAANKGLSWFRRRPLPIPTLLRVEGGDFRDTLSSLNYLS